MQNRLRHSGLGLGSALTITSLRSSWNQQPENIVIDTILGGLRITWTASLDYETEICVSIDGGAYALVTTVGLGVGTYDYICPDGHLYLFKLRFKDDNTVLNIPINIVLTEITDGVRITWDDNNANNDSIEVYANINNYGYILVATVLSGVETYDHLSVVGEIDYKIRAKEGTLPVYSEFSSELSIITVREVPYILEDGNTISIYDSTDLSTITKDEGTQEVSRWNDKKGSGVDLIQTTATKKPTWSSNGILWDGENDFMATGAVGFEQPAMFYMVIQCKNNVNTNGIIMGTTWSSPRLTFLAGRLYLSQSSNVVSPVGSMPINEWKILRFLFNNANSFIQIGTASKTTGSIGSANAMNKIVVGSYYSGGLEWGNIEIKEIIARKTNDDQSTQDIVYDYLKYKYSL